MAATPGITNEFYERKQDPCAAEDPLAYIAYGGIFPHRFTQIRTDKRKKGQNGEFG